MTSDSPRHRICRCTRWTMSHTSRLTFCSFPELICIEDFFCYQIAISSWFFCADKADIILNHNCILFIFFLLLYISPIKLISVIYVIIFLVQRQHMCFLPLMFTYWNKYHTRYQGCDVGKEPIDLEYKFGSNPTPVSTPVKYHLEQRNVIWNDQRNYQMINVSIILNGI